MMDESVTHINSEIGRRIAEFRTHLGLSQGEFADRVGGTKRGVQGNEGGIAMPNSKILAGLVELGANANWILTGQGEMLLAKHRNPPGPTEHGGTSPLAKALFIVEDALSATARQIPTSSKVAITMTALAMLNGSIALDCVAESVRQLIGAMEDGKFSSDEIALVDTLRSATPAKRQMMLAHIRQGARTSESTVTGL